MVPAQIYSFILEHNEYIEEIHSELFLFRHESLHTPVFAIKNSDRNKTFCLAFQTVPEDSTGVAHILEHSVLMGSKKYPVRDVFGEINKGGLMTFLNAMTGSDTTWYPFATRNLQEYFNIMDVYCDVCLHPLLEQNTFDQEGWHYHLEQPGGPLQLQGVVFNEMKGAFSDPIRALFHHTFKNLLPGSTYAHESGGDPVAIPHLSYEQFVAFHRKHYHPSNAMVFFYGDAPLEQELAYLDALFARWAQTHEPTAIVPIRFGTPAAQPVVVEEHYPIQPGSETRQKTFLAVGTVVGNAQDRWNNTCFQIIANILYNSDASPLKKQIIAAGLCKDFGGVFLHDSSFHTIMMTYLIGSDVEQREVFLQIYQETLRRMTREGLDPDLVMSELNRYEFSVREEMNKAQRGLDLISSILPALKYGADPFAAVQMNALLADIRKETVHNRLFETMIERYLLDTPSSVILTLAPDPDQLQDTMREEENLLQARLGQLSPAEQEQLAARTRHLINLQQQANSEKQLALLPRLRVRDLPPRLHTFSVQPETLAGRPLLISQLDTNGICYLDLGFDCSCLDLESLPYLNLFGTILTEIGTRDRDYMNLAKELGIRTGGLSHSFTTYSREGDAGSPPRPYLWLHLKALSRSLQPAMELLAEILNSVNFDNQQRIAEICAREFAWEEHGVQSEGYNLAATRVFAQLSHAGRYNEQVQGATAYLDHRALVNDFSTLGKKFFPLLDSIHRQLLCSDGLTMAVTGSREDIAVVRSQEALLVGSLTNNPFQPKTLAFPELASCQGFTTSSEVLYNVLGGRLFPQGQGYTGHFEVLKTWLSRDYLWNTVRQSGGAYGCFLQFSHISGNIALVSYRDPNLVKTYQAYQAIACHLADLELSETALEQLIIGSYGKFDPHQSPAALASTAVNEYLSGITPASRQARLDSLLSTTVADLRSFADNFERLAKDHAIASIGNRELIENNADLFTSIDRL